MLRDPMTRERCSSSYCHNSCRPVSPMASNRRSSVSSPRLFDVRPMSDRYAADAIRRI